MKKMKTIVMTLLMVILMAGCGNAKEPNIAHADKDCSSMVTPNILECGNDMNTHEGVYYYCVDKNTGVVYLVYDGYKSHSMTLMVNRDGSPITAEQLGIEY